MATPTIKRGSDHFSTVIYEGNGTGQRVGNFIPFTDNGTISLSCLFNDGNGEYLHRTPGSDGNRRTWTWSAWVKRQKLGAAYMFIYSDASANTEDIQFDSSDRLQYYVLVGGSYQINYISNRTFEDKSKWYHIVVRKDTTQSTAADRVRIYVDGDQITSWNTQTQPSQNDQGFFNQSGKQNAIGNFANVGVSDEAVGYMAEVNFADGTSYGPDTFGITDTSTGRWIPKSLGSISYGTHGYRMQFANAAGQTIGDDTSGQGNDYTVVNIGTDQIKDDTPTQNFTNMNGDNTGSFTIAEGGLNITHPGSGQYEQIVGCPSFGVATGKWYWELRVYNKGKTGVGWKSDSNIGGSGAADTGGSLGTVYNVGSSGGFADGEWTDDYSSAVSNFSSFTAASAGDIVMFAIDLDNRKGYVGLNGTWFNSANPANGTGSIGLGGTETTHAIGAKFYPMMLRLDSAGQMNYNFGQNRTFSNAYDKSAAANTATSGPGFFKYAPPTDFLAICQDNLPTTNKDISDFVWIKSRDTASAHMLFDSTRGRRLRLKSDSTSSETDSAGTLEKFLKGGFAVGDQTAVNKDNDSTVAWMWHANGGTTSANTDGSGATIASTIQANQDAGFSIVKTVGTGNAGTIAHGLGKAPEWIIGKNLDTGGNWVVYHKSLGADNIIYLNLTAVAASSSDYWGTTEPTSSLFGVKGGGVDINTNTDNTIFYCWTSIPSYSKFGIYLGNGSTNGPHIITGFKPSWIMTKRTDSSDNWQIQDNTRNPFNGGNWNKLSPDLTAVESQNTNNAMDFLSNGFKLRHNNGQTNGSGGTYIYMAFAEHPFLGDGTNPCPAR